MNNTIIKLIDETTDLSSIKMEKKNWDADIGGVKYQVVRIRGYIHTIGGKHGDCDLWAYPRSEEPSFKNMIQFNAYNPVGWGISSKPKAYICHGTNEVRNSSIVVVTRNGEKFYTCEGRGNTSGIDEARIAISKFTKHPLMLNDFEYDKKAADRNIYYRGIPAVIKRFVKEQACVVIKALDPLTYGALPIYPFEIGVSLNKDDELKVSILSDDIAWFRGEVGNDQAAMHEGLDSEMEEFDASQVFGNLPEELETEDHV